MYLVGYITFSPMAPSKIHAFVFPVPKCAFETTYHGRNWKETEESPLNLLIKRALSIRQNKLNTTCVVNRKYLNNVISQTSSLRGIWSKTVCVVHNSGPDTTALTLYAVTFYNVPDTNCNCKRHKFLHIEASLHCIIRLYTHIL